MREHSNISVTEQKIQSRGGRGLILGKEGNRRLRLALD